MKLSPIFVYDNIDRLEETSGSGTSDSVNGITIHRAFIVLNPYLKLIELKLKSQRNEAKRFLWAKFVYAKLVEKPMLPNQFNMRSWKKWKAFVYKKKSSVDFS